MQQSSPDSHKLKPCLLRQTYPQNLEAKQRIYAESRIRKLVNLRQTAFSNQLCSKAPSKAENVSSTIFGRQSILKQPKHCGSRSRKRKICFMRLNFFLRRYHFLPRFVDKFSRRRLRISVCEKRFFERNAVDVKKCIFAYFGVDKQGIVWISMWISASKTYFRAVCAYSALIAGAAPSATIFISK